VPLAAGHGARVLVVEDNADVGAACMTALIELGYQPTLATHAEDALQQLGKGEASFHVVFSDVMMPGMNGIELGKRIHERHPLLPVVLTSGYSDVVAQHGSYGFELVHKPYSLEALSQALTKAIRGAPRLL
jgi:DNA-binding NtrC family response regulator